MKSAVLFAIAAGASCIAGAGPLSARPTTCQSDVVDFTAAGTFSDGASLSGNLDIDVGCGIVTGADLTDSDFSFFQFNGDGGDGGYESNSTWGPLDFAGGAVTLTLSIDLSGQTSSNSLVGYVGGNLCTSAGNCNNGSGADYISQFIFPGQDGIDLTSGTLTNPNATPEPSAFLLIAAPALWFSLRRRHRPTVA